MGKLTFLAGVGAGYVLGARAGQDRYEQIKSGAAKLWSSPPVQKGVGQATTAAKTQAAPFVTDKLGDAAKRAASQMKEKAGRSDVPESPHRDSEGNLQPDTSGFGPGADRLPGTTGRDS